MLQYIVSIICLGLALAMFKIKIEYKIGILLITKVSQVNKYQLACL